MVQDYKDQRNRHEEATVQQLQVIGPIDFSGLRREEKEALGINDDSEGLLEKSSIDFDMKQIFPNEKLQDQQVIFAIKFK